MTSDDTKSTTDVPWRQVGIGLVIRLRCFSCNTTKARTGGKMFGPNKKLFRCLDCVKQREAMREAHPA